MTTIIYHNPKCGTSRNALALIREAGDEPEIIEYLKDPPGRARIAELIDMMGITPRQLLREKGTPYAELGLDDESLTGEELIGHMVEHPILMNRPVVVRDGKAVLARPSETVLALFPEFDASALTLENGKIVSRRS